jgi:hypothetical protein
MNEGISQERENHFLSSCKRTRVCGRDGLSSFANAKIDVPNVHEFALWHFAEPTLDHITDLFAIV